MAGRARAELEPTLGEQAIAKTVAELPRPIDEVEDGFEGEGKEHALAVARAHIYRLLTGRSFHELERHFDNYPTIRERLGLEENLDHSTFSYSMREQFEGMESYFDSWADYARERLERLPSELVEPHLAAQESPPRPEPLPEIPEEAKDETIRHVKAIMLEETDFDRASNYTYDPGSILDPASLP